MTAQELATQVKQELYATLNECTEYGGDIHSIIMNDSLLVNCLGDETGFDNCNVAETVWFLETHFGIEIVDDDLTEIELSIESGSEFTVGNLIDMVARIVAEKDAKSG